ncbi:helix-turn-helix domain-containing protein [Sphingomonas hengshuiensis]|uniref:helix-turn-helix domain-containing protein n=1 Tax=Sphingomonas hengshuiensis TaxID=1609977 RepID=UPI000698D34E|nr:hypothetical protein [Sphingomonas hengshuiensis]
MTPGTYLRKRRTAAGLSIEDVAALLPTEPHVDLRARVEWLRGIEEGAYPAMTPNTVLAMREAFPFDPDIVCWLFALQNSPDLPAPRLCRICACSEEDACVPVCSWVAPDLCSSCSDEPGDVLACSCQGGPEQTGCALRADDCPIHGIEDAAA